MVCRSFEYEFLRHCSDSELITPSGGYYLEVGSQPHDNLHFLSRAWAAEIYSMGHCSVSEFQ